MLNIYSGCTLTPLLLDGSSSHGLTLIKEEHSRTEAESVLWRSLYRLRLTPSHAVPSPASHRSVLTLTSAPSGCSMSCTTSLNLWAAGLSWWTISTMVLSCSYSTVTLRSITGGCSFILGTRTRWKYFNTIHAVQHKLFYIYISFEVFGLEHLRRALI